MAYWYRILTGYSSGTVNYYTINNGFHTKMKDADGFTTYNYEIYATVRKNTYASAVTTYYKDGTSTLYGTYIRYNKGILLNGYPLVLKSTVQRVESWLKTLPGGSIKGKYTIPSVVTDPALSSSSLDRGIIPLHVTINEKTYNYMLLDYKNNGAWVQQEYTNVEGDISDIYLCNIEGNTPGSEYPEDSLKIYSNHQFITELQNKTIDFGEEQEIPKELANFLKNNLKEYDDGSLDMILYHNNAEQNRLDKTNFLESVSTLNGYLRDKTSITNPSIIIEMSEFPTFNYVYLPKFNRYYYVTNILSIATNLWQIDMHVDVLMSYKDKILLQSAIIERNEYEWNPYLIDSSLPVSKEPNITVEEVPQSIINTTYGDDDMYTFLLEVVG